MFASHFTLLKTSFEDVENKDENQSSQLAD
jgi:hypothetical protein